jgi:hypothetical protein
MTEIHNPNRVLAILTINTTQLPENFPEIIKHEQEVVQQWKEEGILEQLYLRPTRNGAVFIFKNLDEAAVRHVCGIRKHSNHLVRHPALGY